MKRDLVEAKRLERLANDTRTSQVRADQELKQFYSEILPGCNESSNPKRRIICNCDNPRATLI